MTKKRWTSEEINTLMKCIAKHPNKLENALQEAANLLNRSIGACRFKYYNICSNKTATVTSNLKSEKTKSNSPKVKKSSRPRWSEEEDKVLIKQMDLHPHCFQEAFVITARLLGRSIVSCQKRWYNNLSLREDVKSCVFMGKGLQIINRRYPSMPMLVERKKEGWWEKVKKFLWPSD